MKFLLFFLTIAMLLSFIGCSDKEQNSVNTDSSTIETTNVSTEEVELTDTDVIETTTVFDTTETYETTEMIDTTTDTTPPDIIPPDTHKFILSGIPYISQNVKYPNGCESVSTVMALKHIGIDISVDTFIDSHLERGPAPRVNGIGCDPNDVYLGDPRKNSGWGCYAPVIAKALDGILGDTRYGYSLSYTKTIDELCEEYIDNGIPVIVWATLNMSGYNGSDAYAHWKTEEGKKISYLKNLHCLLLVGYDDYNYYFFDPRIKGSQDGGAVGYSREKSNRAFLLLGSQSIALFELADVGTEPDDTETSVDTEVIPDTTVEIEADSGTEVIPDTTVETETDSDIETIPDTTEEAETTPCPDYTEGTNTETDVTYASETTETLDIEDTSETEHINFD